MTVILRKVLVPLTEQQEYLIQIGRWVNRTSRSVRAKPHEMSEYIPNFTRLGISGMREDVFDEPCGCRYTRSSDAALTFFIECGKGRGCNLFAE